MNYEKLKKIDRKLSVEEKKIFYKEKKVRDIILDKDNKYILNSFFCEFNKDSILAFMNNDTINEMTDIPFLVSYINAMLTSKNEGLFDLFLNDNFCYLIANNREITGDYFYNLEASAFNNYYKYLKATNNENIVEIIKQVLSETQIYVLDNNEFSNQELANIIFSLKKETIDHILNNMIDASSLSVIQKFDYNSLAKDPYILPIFMLDNKDVINRVTHTYNSSVYRYAANNLMVNNDATGIENERKKFVNKLITTLDKENEMFSLYSELFSFIKENNYGVNREMLNEYLINKSEITVKGEFNNLVEPLLQIVKLGENAIKEYLQLDTKLVLSEMIIDYHFEDTLTNVLRDTDELLTYNLSIPDDIISKKDLDMYNKINHIKLYDFNTIINLHEELNKEEQIEKFYDNVRGAKNNAYHKMKHEMINDTNILEYKNLELSAQTGLDFLVLDGKPFRALVKSTTTHTSSPGNEKLIEAERKSGCFSYIGNEKLTTYHDPQDMYTLVYTDFNMKRLSHAYPVDSFSSYKQGASFTDKPNKIMNPKNIIRSGSSYNEIIFDTIDYCNDSNELVKPKPRFILCYDKVKKNHLKTAEKLELGICLVITNKYKEEKEDLYIFALDKDYVASQYDSNIEKSKKIYNVEYIRVKYQDQKNKSI